MKEFENLDQLLDAIIKEMSASEIEMYKKETGDYPGIGFHFSGGMAMRNDLGLWYRETKIAKWFDAHGIFHGDDRSGTIYRALWYKLHNLPFDITKEAERYAKFWRETAGIIGYVYDRDKKFYEVIYDPKWKNSDSTKFVFIKK